MTMGDNGTHDATHLEIRNTAWFEPEEELEERRRGSHDAEGHAGSTPRGNPELERDKLGQRARELEGVLGH
jgi:hypothetical protein